MIGAGKCVDTLMFVLCTTLTSSFLLASLVLANPLSNVEEVDKTQVDGEKPTAADTQFLVQSGIDSAGMTKRDASSFYDYNSVGVEEHKRSRNVPSRNPYSWMAKNEEKRARNPYSWLASQPTENNGGAWRQLGFPTLKRQRTGVVAAPSSWAENSAKRAAGVRNPYSWMNFV